MNETIPSVTVGEVHSALVSRGAIVDVTGKIHTEYGFTVHHIFHVYSASLNTLYDLRDEFDAISYVGVRGDHMVVYVQERPW